MAFCVKCGQNLGDADICPDCKHPRKFPKQTTPLQPDPVNTVQPERPAFTAPASADGQTLHSTPTPSNESSSVSPAQENTSSGPSYSQQSTSKSNVLIDETKKIIRGFFSKNPTSVLNHAISSKEKLWLVFAAAYCLSLLFVFTLLTNSSNSIVSGLWSISMSVIPKATLFFYGFLVGLVIYFGNCGLVKAVHSINKQPVPFSVIMNMVSVALLPATLSFASSVIIGFLSLPLALLAINGGAFMGILMIYSGIQKEAVFEDEPIWLYVAANAALTIILFFVIYQIILPGITSTISRNAGNIFNGMW